MDVGAQYSAWSMSRNAQFMVMVRASGEVGGAGRRVAADKAGASEGRGGGGPRPSLPCLQGSKRRRNSYEPEDPDWLSSI